MWRAYKRGVYPRVTDPRAIAALMRGRMVRLGSYGDPAAVPAWVWGAYAVCASGSTGYTHQWRGAPELRGLCMASCDTLPEAEEARAAGWRAFRVAPKGDAFRVAREARCPASEEAGRRVTCAACPIRCNGAQGSPLSVVIQAHGAKAGRVRG